MIARAAIEWMQRIVGVAAETLARVTRDGDYKSWMQRFLGS